MSSHQRVIIENVDYDVMGLTIRLLEYKTDLINLFKEYNEKAEALSKIENGFDNTFFQ